MKHLWQNQVNGIPFDRQTIKSLKAKLEDKIAKFYHENEFKSINHRSKLRTYKEFKTNLTLENYVNIYDVPLAWRKLYCSFRSAHDLEIERGRYSRPYIAPENRLCKICSKTSETEEHFIIDCKEYHDL